MNSAIIVMTILGCGQTDAACDYIRTVDTHFASRQQCEARTEAELLKTGSDNYPNVIAVCGPPRREVVTSAVPDLPAPSTAGQAEMPEPKVIRMPEEAKPKNPLTWTVDKTRRLIGGTKRVIASVWHGLTDKVLHRNRRNDDPIRLGRYASTDR